VTVDIPATMLLDRQVLDDPYPFYRRLHREAPVWQVPSTQVFVASTFETVADATSRVADFSSNMRCLLYRDDAGLPARLSFGGEDGVQTLATADPPIHTVHRSVVFPELMAKRMASLESEIAEIAERCITRALDDGDTDFMRTVGNVVPITLVSRLIGFRDSDPDRLLQAAFDGTRIVGGSVSLSELNDLMVRSGEIGTWIAEQLEGVAAAPSENLLGTVARGIQTGDLQMQEGIVTLQTLLSAGGESTSSLLGNAVRILAERQDLQAELRQSPEMVPAFVEEALRLESPFRHLTRSVSADTKLGDVDIPAGSTLMLFWGAANRDDDEYEAADQVNLQRPAPRHHLAFGRGIHHCVGAPLARLEGRIVLTRLLEETNSITLDPAQAPRWIESLQTRRHECLPVLLVPR
jgi:cytochrome P450 family 144